MILRGRVGVVRSGGVDRFGDPLPATTHGPYPAEVQPVSAEEKSALGTTSTTVLRAVLGPVLPGLPGPLTSGDAVTFAGRTYNVTGVEPWHVDGRPHHLEVTMVSQTG